MRGSITEWGGAGSGKWRLRVFVGRDAQGKKQWVSRNFTGGKREAQTALNRLIADVEAGQVKSHAGSVGELLDRWLDDIEPHRSKYTMKSHRRCVDKDIKPAIGSLRLDRLTARHLDTFYRALLDRGLSPATVRRHHSIVSAALSRAVKWDMIGSNPAERATPPGLTRSTVQAPSVEDVQRLVAAAEAEDAILATAIALAATTGARRGELCALRWSNVDWERRRIRIDQSLTVIKREASLGPTKTHQRRDVAIDEGLVVLLEGRRQAQREAAQACGIEPPDDAFILSRAIDSRDPCLPDGLTSAYERLARKLGVGGHFHQLRHFAATVAIASGTDVRTVSGRLGHADPSVTLKVYAHAVEARDRELAGLLGAAVLGRQRASHLVAQAEAHRHLLRLSRSDGDVEGEGRQQH